MDVGLVVPELGQLTGGIGRYARNFIERLLRKKRISASLNEFRFLPRFESTDVLKALPIGENDWRTTDVVHFTRIPDRRLCCFVVFDTRPSPFTILAPSCAPKID